MRLRAPAARTPAALVLLAVAVLVAVVVAVAVSLAVREPRAGDGDAPPGRAAEKPRLPEDTSTSVERVDVPPGPVRPPESARAPLGPPIGFAAGVTGGQGGTLYEVTSAEDSVESPAEGTLRHGLELGEPVWIVFERDMQIELQGALPVPSDTTIDGRGHDVRLSGKGLPGLQVYDATNVIIENLTLTDFGDTSKTDQNDPDDAIDVQRSRGVWIDHCTVARAGDKLISVEDGGEEITISWNRFEDQEQTLQVGALSTAHNDVRATVTVHHNFFDRVGYRLPMVQYAKVHVFNNYMALWSSSGVTSTRLAQVYLESNVFAPGSNRRAAQIRPAQKCNDKRTFCDARSGYLHSVDNLVTGRGFIRTTGPEHVFSPQAAYPYEAEPATPALAAAIQRAAGAGGVPEAP